MSSTTLTQNVRWLARMEATSEQESPNLNCAWHSSAPTCYTFEMFAKLFNKRTKKRERIILPKLQESDDLFVEGKLQ